MHVLSTLGLSLLVSVAAGWQLQEDYGNDSSFFDKFTFFTDEDPTHGFVTYVDQSTATSAGLISANDGTVHIGVDSTNSIDPNGAGRQSVRISSTATYSVGTLSYSRFGTYARDCVWKLACLPWPAEGEIDIIEYVNTNQQNQMTLHTSPGCSITNYGSGTSAGSTDCEGSNGCGVIDTDPNSLGSGFNNAGGGVYATQWAADSISIWFFPRNSITSDITNGTPDPTQWGTPVASFGGSSCNFSTAFANMQIVFDITFCGDWAGSSGSYQCGGGATCQQYVADTPSAYSDSYWGINSLKVYTGTGSQKRAEVPKVNHAHAAEHINRRSNHHARPGPRPNLKSRRDTMAGL
ncbi:concanavalin A-like lectin/glucanase domain-containing protein [Penicillium chermesinum]|uniref:Concanavalin A-like lectin/glucanase domain-containing protein n=1 Tax=Penicillium chermesinum TaxID=63820 RepID=A0A9W9TW25_9EURO|nr:concanavalin A-like lectin/glucanase domain-containing protein [Penicillium chermesinum]KAJ5245901.1 concanavalin A-like lectin/glucanase domain-containing protein [Penicillium chermesinum]